MENRYGPNPVIPYTDVGEAAERQTKVMLFLSEAANVEYPAPLDSVDWFQVILAGFNYVDEVCSIYLHDVFIRDREKQRASGLLTVSGTATNAIMTATGASKEAIAVAAQLFGLATGATLVVTNSYLFAVPPSTIFGTVEKMQAAYQQKTLEEFKAGKLMLSEPAAYGRIRGYLALCLPENIESKITAVVASAGATADNSGKPKSAASPSETSAKVNVNLTAQ